MILSTQWWCKMTCPHTHICWKRNVKTGEFVYINFLIAADERTLPYYSGQNVFKKTAATGLHQRTSYKYDDQPEHHNRLEYGQYFKCGDTSHWANNCHLYVSILPSFPTQKMNTHKHTHTLWWHTFKHRTHYTRTHARIIYTSTQIYDIPTNIASVDSKTSASIISGSVSAGLLLHSEIVQKFSWKHYVLESCWFWGLGAASCDHEQKLSLKWVKTEWVVVEFVDVIKMWMTLFPFLLKVGEICNFHPLPSSNL